jgi:hypothetical protein
MMSFSAEGSSCRSCNPESLKFQQSGVVVTNALTLHYLQKKFDVILGKLNLVEQVPDEIVYKDARDDLEIVEFGNKDDKVRCLFSWLFLHLRTRSHVFLVRRNRGLDKVCR